ncbi:hypothetical protein ATE47_12445 [Chryseobacterium sp. IHB B 17019]|uniref:hypothetical protein n=1 Tax=Chryseobacterium sp. IHB B 17019 TaxID=1721091 RepID=UPI00072094F6|nr:hypothetical protein [Chryseobacterium sp. IHB B 17019]ALR31282.1 hypothetical protein ATE47_12445 [Chryseobacterium sp. IHB B 17019]
MEDITIKIKNALSYKGNWKISDFFFIIELLEKNRIDISFWENEENWATLLNDNIAIGYLWKMFPILIIEDNYLNLVKLNLQNYTFINTINVENLSFKTLKLEDGILSDYLDNNIINYNKFSANDLWFYTNSI